MLARFSTQYPERNIKVIMTANQKIAKYRKEPTKTHRKNKPTNARENADDQVVVGLSMAFDWLRG